MEGIKSAIILVLVTFLIIFFSVKSCQKSAEKVEVETFDSTIIIKQKLALIQAQGEKQLKQIKQDSLKTSIALQALKIENKNLRKKLADMRPDITRIADSIPVIEEWVSLSDSLDVVQEAELDTMRAEKIRTWKSFTSILENKDDQIKLYGNINTNITDINRYLSKQVRKERRRKTFWKVTTAISATAILYLAIHD